MDYLTPHEIEFYTKRLERPKHKLLIGVLLYTGLRVSEMVSLKWKDIDFRKRVLTVRSLKKKDKEEYRDIPIHDNLFQVLSDYTKSLRGKKLNAEDYIFESPSKKGKHILRGSVNAILKDIAEKNNMPPVNPHKFRHTFATNLRRSGSELHTIQSLLGHEEPRTTLMYAHITPEESNIALNNAYKKPFFQKIKEKLGFADHVPIINLVNNRNLVGRKAEILQLSENIEKGISTIVIGEKGIGKSLIIDNIKHDNIIRLDDLKGLKNTLKKLIMHLANEGKEHELDLIFEGLDPTKIQKESIRELTRIITTITEEKEFVITIDSIDSLTPREGKFLEELANHFIVICGTRQLKLNVAQTAVNFKIVEVLELTRSEAYELTNLMIQKYNLNTNDYELLRNHMVEESRQIPERIEILAQRFSSEAYIDAELIRTQKLLDVTKEFDATFAIVLVISAFAVLRYLSAEVNNSSYKFLGGIAMIVLLFSRSIFAKTKKKTAF